MRNPNAVLRGITVSAFAMISPALAAQSVFGVSNENALIIETDVPTFKSRGVVEASQTAEIAATLSARIINLPYKSGQSFKKGALLVRFDCQQENAEAQALEQALKALSVKHDNVKALLELGAAGALEESMAGADVARAKADIQVAKARLKRCAVYAPYAGSVRTRHVSAFDTPAAGAPLYSIIRSGQIEINLIAPSAWMRWMKAGTPFFFTVDETGATHAAKITRLGAAVDPVSQTIEVTAKFNAGTRAILPGMSGVANFDLPQSEATPSAAGG